MILSRGENREEIEAIVAAGPLIAEGVATYELVQFQPGRRVMELDGLL